MKERPIIFSTDMVKAILDGRKTQTRRIMKLVPRISSDIDWQADYFKIDPDVAHSYSPYGQPGDMLYVRESYTKMVPQHLEEGDNPYAYKANVDAEGEEIRQEYLAAGYPYQWKPSIHMPKVAARIWLEITNVRVERLQKITEGDAKAEGAPLTPWEGVDDSVGANYICGFINIWREIHGNSFGPHGWNSNPWVWVIEFKVISTTGKPQTA